MEIRMLTVGNHSRDAAGMTYIYPVISRRAGGVSVGINLNTNNACNWHCCYCQVPNLTRGGPPRIDLDLLERELRLLLDAVCFGDFLEANAPGGSRRLVDLAFSGNGEPTSSSEFLAAVECVARVYGDYKLRETAKLRLITNGSFLHRHEVRSGIALLGDLGGEVWFKVDRATPAAIELVNGIRYAPERMRESLLVCAGLADTWVQSCLFAIDDVCMSDAEAEDYLRLIKDVSQNIKGVLLYGLARPSLQSGSERLSRLPEHVLQEFARRIEKSGATVIVTP